MALSVGTAAEATGATYATYFIYWNYSDYTNSTKISIDKGGGIMTLSDNSIISGATFTIDKKSHLTCTSDHPATAQINWKSFTRKSQAPSAHL